MGINQDVGAGQQPNIVQHPDAIESVDTNESTDSARHASLASGTSHATAYTLVFFTAAWCDPAIPMRVIFDETLRDLARLRPAAQLSGVVVDVDDEEHRRKEGQPGTSAVSDELLDSIDMLPTIMLLTDAGERERFVGQLPKLTIRERLLAILDA
ncbi:MULTISPECIES: thioredoxin family protein [unclassified Actinobaculum]|uniref:thioredoxin family protein n=1 Tax=unclassified Actinobaculum TaxID=2609299 RepID=UPI000D5260EE|nr:MULTISPECIES: thioredoxin family protein [unclassified Actinobaculum]AWE43326.1 hypothetical protein DDD63_11855 [Actinobaculum sp. 313]RTE49774.1 thioredoxin [Actinobaculum sp. 352]